MNTEFKVCDEVEFDMLEATSMDDYKNIVVTGKITSILSQEASVVFLNPMTYRSENRIFPFTRLRKKPTMNTEFQWTDERVVDILNTHRDSLMIMAKGHYDLSTVRKWKDAYLQSSKSEKDWEIVAYKTKYMGEDDVIIHKDVGGIWRPVKGYISLYTLSNDEELKKVGTIYKVHRLSDNEVFSVGDTVKGRFEPFVIAGFRVKGKNWLSVIAKDGGIMVDKTTLEFLSKIDKKPVLFTTEDGVDIFDGDCYFTVSKDFRQGGRSNGLGWYNPSSGEKYFNTREKAEEYILMNKPCLSLTDVKEAYGTRDFIGTDFIASRLKEIAKSKQKQQL